MLLTELFLMMTTILWVTMSRCNQELIYITIFVTTCFLSIKKALIDMWHYFHSFILGNNNFHSPWQAVSLWYKRKKNSWYRLHEKKNCHGRWQVMGCHWKELVLKIDWFTGWHQNLLLLHHNWNYNSSLISNGTRHLKTFGRPRGKEPRHWLAAMDFIAGHSTTGWNMKIFLSTITSPSFTLTTFTLTYSWGLFVLFDCLTLTWVLSTTRR